ncbi:MAG: nuclear transport factor 2 family protein [Burkholderiales bacterium]
MSMQQVLDIEEIKRLKAQYVRFGDTKQWDKWGQLFTDDVTFKSEGSARLKPDDPTSQAFQGIANKIEDVKRRFASVTTIHQIYAPEITLTSASTAEGIWAFHDHLISPNGVFKGWGHYHEKYAKQRGIWKICAVHYTRIHVEETWI